MTLRFCVIVPEFSRISILYFPSLLLPLKEASYASFKVNEDWLICSLYFCSEPECPSFSDGNANEQLVNGAAMASIESFIVNVLV